MIKHITLLLGDKMDTYTEWFIGQIKQMIDSYIEELILKYNGKSEDFDEFMMNKVKEHFFIIQEIHKVKSE